MVALIASLGMLLALLLAPAVPQPRSANPQLGPCPPCADQLPPAARVIGTAAGGPDASGAIETLVAYFVRDPSFTNVELGSLGALVVRTTGGRSEVFRLGDQLGENPYAELAVRDLTADGGNELAITTAVGAHSTLLHIYRWNGAGYERVEEFFGDSGVRLLDLDGDGVDEVLVGMRHYDRAQTRSDTVMRWNGARYVAEYTRWGFTFEDPAFHDYPEAVVLKYYLAIDSRDFRTAWNLLGPSMQGGQSYESFVAGFDTTMDVRIGDLEVVQEEDERATVRVELSSLERSGGVNRYQGTWIAERRGGGPWRLTGAYVVAL